MARIVLLLSLISMVQGKAGGFLLAQNDLVSAQKFQESGDQKLEAGDLNGAKADFLRSRRLFFALGKPADAVSSGMGLAMSEVYRGKYQRGRDVLLQSRDSLLALDPQNDSLMANVYGLLGSVYNLLGDQEKALETALEAVAVKKRIPGLEAGELEYNYYLIGAIYFERNDFAHAIEYERAARKGYLAAGMVQEYAETGINLGLALVRNGQYEEALQVLNETEKLADLSRLEPQQRAALFLNLGLANLELNRTDSAREAFLRVKAMPDVEEKHYAMAVANLGFLYYQQGLAGPAIEHLNLAITSLRFQGQPDPDEMGKLRLHLAQAYRLNHEHEAALRAVEDGILRQLYLSTNIEIDTVSNYSRPCDRRTLLRLLYERATLLKIMGRPKEAQEAYRNAFTVIDLMRHTFLGEDSRQFLATYVQPIYEESLELTWELYDRNQQADYFEEALMIAERNKAVLLLEAMQEATARRGDGTGYQLPDSLIEAERTLKSDIAWYQKQLYLSENAADRSRIGLYEGYLIDKQSQLDRLETKIQSEFPFLGRRGIGKQSDEENKVSLAALQTFCQTKNRAVLEYFAGKRHTYALMISADTLVFERFYATDRDSIARYRRAISDWNFIYDQPARAWLEVKSGGRSFYRRLLEPLFRGSIPPALVVILDGHLSYLPFEALLTDESGEEGNYSSLPYLIRQCEISYAYSAKLLLSTSSSHLAVKYTGKALAFAPEYSQPNEDSPKTENESLNRTGAVALPGAREEVRALSRHLKVESYSGRTATEAQFKARAGAHAVLHLAMHGILDDAKADYSYLDFAPERIQLGQRREDGSLFAYELEQMRLPAQLVVLSACETGTGQLVKGEGVLSLARGFRFAGAQSVVMSLWKLEDRSTAQLMDLFYGGLADEMGKGNALRKAKLAYLDQADDFTSHPGFWAGLVLIGNTDSLHKPMAPYPWILPLAALMVILVGFGIEKKFVFRRGK